MPRTGIAFTAADYRALPDNAPRMELLDGEYSMSPSPSRRHQEVLANLFALLLAFLRAHPVGKAWISPFDTYLSDSDVLQPDILLLLAAHLDRVADDGVHGAPDLCVEVLSPGTAGHDFTLKREIYRRSGVAEYWIVDPRAESVTLYRLQENPEPRKFDKGERFASPLLPDFAPELAQIFAR